MSTTIRYEMLPTEESEDVVNDDAGEAQGDSESTVVPIPIPQSPTAQLPETPAVATEPTNNTASLLTQPPSYDIAIDLPSYEEAERSKAAEAERAQQREQERRSQMTVFDRLFPTSQEDGQQPDEQLGTDAMFLCTFLMSFVFNWIGLLFSLCITQTVAGRLGAMSGFGLSLVKWVAIMKHSAWAGDVVSGDSLLWWLLILFGFLIFFRGATQYIRIKYHWQSLNQNTRNNIFYYF